MSYQPTLLLTKQNTCQKTCANNCPQYSLFTFVSMRIRIVQKQWNWNMSTSCLHTHSQYCLFQVSPIIREETIQQARGYWFQSSTLAAGTIICRLICSPSKNISSIFKCNTYFTPSLHPGEPQSLVMRLQQRRNQVNPVLI